MRFSQRIGKKPIRLELQIDSMDNNLRNGLWNAFDLSFISNYKPANSQQINRIKGSNLHYLFSSLWTSYFKMPLDTLNVFFDVACKDIRKYFFECAWFEVYDFVEFVAQTNIWMLKSNHSQFLHYCNNALTEELSGYRLLNGYMIQITNENELDEIYDAISKSDNSNLKGMHTHLETAVVLLSDRKKPDHRNSIKESISALESLSQVITGDSKTTLGKALKIIQDGAGLHPALVKGFEAIYGYTSDADGIRHALLEETTLCFEDAKFMLVSCSAFCNYLLMKSEKAGIKI